MEAISVEQLLKNHASYDREIVSVRGQLIATFATSLLCAPSESLDVTEDRLRITLDQSELVDRCFQVVSPYVGGPWCYHDPATVTGRFFAEPTPRIAEMTALVIRRDDTDYPVDL